MGKNMADRPFFSYTIVTEEMIVDALAESFKSRGSWEMFLAFGGMKAMAPESTRSYSLWFSC